MIYDAVKVGNNLIDGGRRCADTRLSAFLRASERLLSSSWPTTTTLAIGGMTNLLNRSVRIWCMRRL